MICTGCKHDHDEDEWVTTGNFCDWCETLNYVNDPQGDYMSKNGQAPWRAACVGTSAFDGSVAGFTWDGKANMIVVWKQTEEAVLEYLADYYPQLPVISYDEFEAGWRKLIKMPKARLLGPGKKVTGGVARGSYQAKDPQPYSSTFELLEGESAETLIAPVAFAKRIGVPPQYVYQVISKGRVETVGERPKKATIGDLCRHYNKEIKPKGD